MSRLAVKIDDELDKKFRIKVFELKGMKHGNITEAIEEAIQLWLNSS